MTAEGLANTSNLLEAKTSFTLRKVSQARAYQFNV